MRIVLIVDRWGWLAKRREFRLIFVSLFLCLSGAGCQPATTAQSKNGAYTPTAASISADGNGTAEAEVSPAQMPKIKDEDLKRLVELRTRVTQNELGRYQLDVRRNPAFSNQSIELMALCPNVEDLTMERVAISDEGLSKIKEMKLTRLILNGSPITAKGIEMLSQQPMSKSLLSLGLKEIAIGDEDVSIFRKFEKLQRLDISDSFVTDASLPTLQLLPLLTLNISNTKITSEGIKKLMTMMPNTQIISEQTK